LVRLKSKEERQAQWERLTWHIAARKGLSLEDAAGELVLRALFFWIGRVAKNFMGGLASENDDVCDPYLERAVQYAAMAREPGELI
jgi:hypothetical protein